MTIVEELDKAIEEYEAKVQRLSLILREKKLLREMGRMWSHVAEVLAHMQVVSAIAFEAGLAPSEKKAEKEDA